MTVGSTLDGGVTGGPLEGISYASGTEVPEPIILIDRSGRIFWKGREVKGDDDFRAAMLDLAKYLCARP